MVSMMNSRRSIIEGGPNTEEEKNKYMRSTNKKKLKEVFKSLDKKNKDPNKKFRKKYQLNLYGVSGISSWWRAKKSENMLKNKFQDQSRFLKNKGSVYKDAFWDIYRNDYKSNRLTFTFNGITYGQYRESDGQKKDGKDLLSFFKVDKSKLGGKEWFEVIFDHIHKRALEKKNKRNAKDGSGNGDVINYVNKYYMKSKDIDQKFTDLENDIQATYVATDDIDDGGDINGTNDLLLTNNYLYKTFILTQDAPDVDNWYADDDTTEKRKNRVQGIFDDYIRFYGDGTMGDDSETYNTGDSD